jgi:YVTN family beta-propeller protein
VLLALLLLSTVGAATGHAIGAAGSLPLGSPYARGASGAQHGPDPAGKLHEAARATSGDGAALGVPAFRLGTVSRASAACPTNYGIIPAWLAYDSATATFWVASAPSCVDVFTLSTSGYPSNLSASIPVGTNPFGVAVDNLTNDVFVTNAGSNNVSVISATNETPVGSVDVGTNPHGVAFDWVSNEIYVANTGSNNLTVISGTTLSVIATVAVGTSPIGVAADPASGEVFVANFGSGNVTAISDATNSPMTQISTGNGSYGVAWDNTSNQIFVTNELSNNVSVIDATSNSVVASIPVAGVAWPLQLQGLAYDPATGLVWVGAGTPAAAVLNATSDTLVGFAGTDPAGVAYDPANGDVCVTNTANVTFECLNFRYVTAADPLTFHETGLPLNLSWTVEINWSASNATTQVSKSPDISFGTLGEHWVTYGFRIPDDHGYVATPASGVEVLVGSPVVVNVSFGPVWTNVTIGTTPHARYGAATAYDPLAGYLLLFGGAYGPYGTNSGGSGTDLNDTWIFTNGSWVNITSTAGHAPPPRAFASLTYDQVDGFMILVGGQATKAGSPCDLACFDTWKFSDGLWSPLAATTPQVYGFSAVYDSTAGFVLGTTWWLGGSGNPGGGATYGYLGGNWTEIGHNQTTNTTGVSPNFWYPSLVNDPALGGVMMYGGQDWGGAPYSETWVYAGGNWTDLTGKLTLLPPATPYPAASFDNSSQVIVLTDAGTNGRGGTWTFNGTWGNDSQSPEPSGLGAVAFGWDSALNASVQFGGAASGGLANSTNSTWEWSTTPSIVGASISARDSPVDVSTPVQFNASWRGGLGPFQYLWSFGDNSTNSSAHPVHAFGAPGGFNVTVRVTDISNHTATAQTRFLVDAGLFVSPRATSNPSEIGLAVNLTAGNSGGVGPYTYFWRFGDGQTSTLANPMHSYDTSETFVARVWVNDSGGGSATNAASVSVQPALSLKVQAANSSVVLGSTVLIQASPSGGVGPYTFAYSGLPPGCLSANLGNLNCTPSQPATYNVTASVRDALGVGRTVSVDLVVFVPVCACGPAPVPSSALPALLLIAGIAAAVVAAAVAATVLRGRRARKLPPPQPPSVP